MDTIYIAKLGKTVGLKGQQKLHIDSDFPDQFKKNTKLITDKHQELIIESYNNTSNVIKFIGIDTIEAAKKLTNRQLFVSTEATRENCKLEKKQFFWFDMIDCVVKENEEVLGKVIDIQRMPLSDYMMIQTASKLVEEGFAVNFLLPYLDEYIQEVQIEKKTIFVQKAKEILAAS